MTGQVLKLPIDAYPLMTETMPEARLEWLEKAILDHSPQSRGEAVVIMDLAISELTLGGRTYGRDIAALERVREWMQSQR